jgi:hypothetical protein
MHLQILSAGPPVAYVEVKWATRISVLNLHCAQLQNDVASQLLCAGEDR